MKRIFRDNERVWFNEDHMSGWGRVALTGASLPEADIFNDKDIVTVAKDTGGEIECLARDVYTLAAGLTHKGHPIVWDHDDQADRPFHCPATGTGIDLNETEAVKERPIKIVLLLGEKVSMDFLRKHQFERHTADEWAGMVKASPEADEGLYAHVIELKSNEELKGFISGVREMDDYLSEDHYNAAIISGERVAGDKE